MLRKPQPFVRRASASLLPALFILISVTHVLATRHERLVENWRPLHYAVNLTLDDRLTEISKASVKVTVQILRTQVAVIDFDFGDMPVDSVNVNNVPAHFEQTTGKLNVKLAQPFASGTPITITVNYHGKPKDGLILKSDRDGKPSAVGDNWPDRVHHWIPCLDHPSAKATVSFSVTASGQNLVVANGGLIGVSNSGTTRTWTYNERVPVPPYCMIIAVGQFAKEEPKDLTITPLSYYVPQSQEQYAMQGFAPAAPSLKFFTQTIAPYPFEKLALIVGATQFGGMENSSAIVFHRGIFDSRSDAPNSRAFNIRRGLVEIVAHEIAHQWFGDSVTESTWSDLWLSEGFATYFAGLFVQKQEGEQAFREYMKHASDKYFQYEGKTRTPIFDSDTEDLFKLLNPNNYEKGAWVLHMLRSQLGDADFFRGIRAFYAAHKEATANTEDLRRALEQASGRDLSSFFRSWVYGIGHPRYELSWHWDRTRVLRLSLRQTQREAGFPNAVPLEITTAAGKQRVVLKPDQKEFSKEIRLDAEPKTIVLDPDETILKEAQVRHR